MATAQSSPIHRFLFSSFDTKDAKKEEAPPTAAAQAPQAAKLAAPAATGPLPLPLQLPAITEKEVQTAKTEAQAQGYREGYAAAQAKFNKEAEQREETVKGLLEVIANRITMAAEAHASNMKDKEALMAKLVMAAARKVAGEALRREPYTPVEALLKECLGLIIGKPKVTVTVSNALAAGLKQRIDTLRPMLQGFSGELNVQEDVGLLDQDCRVDWDNGGASRDTTVLWSAIEAVIMKTSTNT